MARTVFLLFLAASLACCARYVVPEAQGPLFALNPGLWQPAAADLDRPPVVRTR